MSFYHISSRLIITLLLHKHGTASINLIGGSLQDIVNDGGCDDEITLSNIAVQALIGLAFLHRYATSSMDNF